MPFWGAVVIWWEQWSSPPGAVVAGKSGWKTVNSEVEGYNSWPFFGASVAYLIAHWTTNHYHRVQISAWAYLKGVSSLTSLITFGGCSAHLAHLCTIFMHSWWSLFQKSFTCVRMWKASRQKVDSNQECSKF